MPLIVTGARGKWDRTPKGRLHTVKYRLDACPDLGQARAVQRDAFDWAMEVLERHHDLPVRPAKAGQQSLWGKLTRARMSGKLPRAPLTLLDLPRFGGQVRAFAVGWVVGDQCRGQGPARGALPKDI